MALGAYLKSRGKEKEKKKKEMIQGMIWSVLAVFFSRVIVFVNRFWLSKLTFMIKIFSITPHICTYNQFHAPPGLLWGVPHPPTPGLLPGSLP